MNAMKKSMGPTKNPPKMLPPEFDEVEY